MKKILSIILCFAITTSMSCASNSISPQTDESWQLPDDITTELFETYASEFDLIEEETGNAIEAINDETIDAITNIANLNLFRESYYFSALMTDICEARLNLSDHGQRSEELVRYRAYGPITGKFLNSAPVGTSVEISGSTSISVSTEFIEGAQYEKGSTLGVSYGFTGPERGTELFNGMAATHNFACGVLYGTVWRKGNTNLYQIPDLNCTVFVSAARHTAEGPVYVDSGDAEYEETSYWVSLPTFKSYLDTHPEFYLTGNS